MRIRDLLAAESIELNGSAAGKQDVLNKMVDLMAKAEKSAMWKLTARGFLQEKKKEQPESEKELRSHTASQML